MRSAEASLYLISYDIASDKRRTKVFKILCGFGTWTQYSLFECWLTKQQRLELQHKLKPHIKDGDSLRLYLICKNCVNHVETIGSPRPEEQQTIII